MGKIFDNEKLKNVDLDYFAFDDPIVEKLGLAILASKSLLDHDYLVLNWHIQEFETIAVLMEAKTIPFFADYLSFAYVEGIGLAKFLMRLENYLNMLAKHARSTTLSRC